MMQGGFRSRIAIPGGEMMSFVSNGRKNDRVVVKEEDLSLFRELHRQRHCNLLLQPLALSDEFDSPFPYLPNGNNDQILRISSGSGGSDLLVENDKHDYDWLKTPPATPLFPSIEMDAVANNNNNYYYNALTSSKEPPVGVLGPLLQQPISRFGAGTGNNSEVSMSSSCRPSNININVNINSNGNIVQKTKPSTSKNDVQVQKRPSSTRTNSGTRPRLQRQNNNNNNNNNKNGNIVLLCKETPPNLRTEQRSSSTTRGRRAASTTAKPRQKSCSPTVDRGRKLDDDHHHQPIILKAATTKKEMNGSTTNKGTLVVGSRMVEKLMNARKSASTTNNVGHQYRMKDINANPNPNNQKSTAFGLPWNNNNVIITRLKPTFK